MTATPPVHKRNFTASAFVVAATFIAGPLFAAGSGDPRVPPGRDPGGVPVALIGPGIDYRAPEIAQRIARDGEGELIGWDFVDNDLRPFEPEAACPVRPCGTADDAWRSNPQQLMLGEAGASKLIVLRTRDGDRGALAAAIAFAARSPARIIPILAVGAEPGTAAGTAAGPDWQLMIEAARRFSNLLFIVPAHGPPISIPGFDNLAIGNLLIVAPATAAGEVAAGTAGLLPPVADIAVTIDPPRTVSLPGRPPPSERQRAELAAARVAALAARLLAADPILDAHGMKQRIHALAQPALEADKDRTRSGWIAEPRRHFWLE